jgi:hypothetical protein
MLSDHWSDCALHSGPAKWPMPCDCGGITGGIESGSWFYRWGYSRAVGLRNFLQLLKARLVWLRENHESPLRYLRIAASRKALDRHP